MDVQIIQRPAALCENRHLDKFLDPYSVDPRFALTGERHLEMCLAIVQRDLVGLKVSQTDVEECEQ